MMQTEHVFESYKHPARMPDISKAATFDPFLGFPKGRKEREFPLTEEDLHQSPLHPARKDYCSHLSLAFSKCKYQFPLSKPFVCADIRHALLHCHQNDQLLRSKEYERERRLIAKYGKNNGKPVEG